MASRSTTPPRGLPTRCPVERLAVPARSIMDIVIGMDPTGRYIVGRTNPGGKSPILDMLIWDNGLLHVVHVPGDQQLPTDINTSGVAVGVSGTTGEQAWMYRDGAATYLPGQRPTRANAINDGGVVVGSAGRGQPVVWRSPSTEPTVLRMPSGAWEGEARDIAADGTIVGTLNRQGASMPQAYAWLPNGTLRKLRLPVIDGAKATTSRAMSIADGWVAGTARGPHTDVPTRWNLRTGEVQTYAEMSIGGRSVSADGWLVGNNREGRGVLASHPGALTLPDLNNHNSSLANYAVAISRDGHLIAGDGSAGGDLPVPVIWRCG
ncbi:hypothetical protein [Micromonospora sp. U21]|uniref:hypothetical protein n=1 Tax=Micromonospora sp. U21 TaxID=2824899 RepID=UPI001B35C5DC|nr:hypothetical protein [Micromonospora sp. U21]MBQ0905277.1 hypothetical protein [Micromonospora sp. U21]